MKSQSRTIPFYEEPVTHHPLLRRGKHVTTPLLARPEPDGFEFHRK